METISNVKKRIITSVIAIVLLLITLFGITYAYFVADVKGNENDKSISATSGKLELIYDDEESIVIAEKILPGFTSEEKIFSIKNTGTSKINSYDVVLENVTNELDHYKDLTYVLTCKSYKTTEYEISGLEANEYGTCNGNQGIFPKYDSTLITNSIDKGITHYYILKVVYNETYTDQSADMNKIINAKVNIEDNSHNMKKLMIYGNSIQNASPTLESPAKIKSVGDKNNLLEHGLIRMGSTTTEVKNKMINTLIELTPGEYTLSFDTITNATTYRLTWVIFTDKNATNEITEVMNDYMNLYVAGNDSGYYNGSRRAFMFNSNREISYNELKIVVTNTCYVSFVVFSGDTTASTEVVNPKLEIGNTRTEYFSDDKYKIPISLRGKNILDMSNLNVTQGYYLDSSGNTNSTNTNFIKIAPIKVKPNTTYTISSNVYLYSIWFLSGGENTGIKSIPAYDLKKKTFTTPSNCNYIRVSLDLRKMDKTEKDGVNLFEWAMLEVGEGDGIYEPYIKPIETNIYLNQPLRKVGDVADYIDFANNKEVRYIDVLDESGTLSIEESYRVLEIPREEPIDLPNLSNINNNFIVEVNTEIEPSKIEY